MRNKHYCILAISFMLSIFFSLVTCQTAFTDSAKVISAINDKAVFFRKVNGKFEPVGRLYKDELFRAAKIYKNWYTIQLGNDSYYVHKQHVKEVPASLPAVNEWKDPIKIVFPKTDVPVYKTKSLDEPIGTIYKNNPLPVEQIEGPWYKINFAGRLAYVHQNNVAGLATELPIIVYHHLLKERENGEFKNEKTVVSYEQFAAQMKFLHDHGYHTITLPELEQFLQGKRNLPAKSIMIHFDDGLKTNYIYAYPVLKRYHFHAVAFLITSRNTADVQPFHPDTLQFLSWPEINQMRDVFEFASHTHALHNRGTDGIGNLLKEPRQIVKADLLQSRKLLNGTTYFAYPFGQYKQETIDILKETGFTMAFTTKIGTVKPGDDPYQLKRYAIEPNTTLEEFKHIIRLVE
ncbi:polysaccharide deacetylase family protein [Parageobacillus toebii]|uniref:polysaccharide deacetylase family protein n=1 Tax=Parageobacillus toebii TaxID=153151 RepID=UPI0035B53D9B